MATPVQLTPQQQQALQAFAAKYPGFDYGEGFAGIKKNPAAVQDFLQLWHTLGLNDGEANSRAHFSADGTGVDKDRALWKQFAMMAATVAAPAAIYSALPAGAAGIAGVEGASSLAAGAATPSLLHSLLPSIIGAGASLGGTALAAHADTEAAKIAAAQADKALELTKEQYALQRQDTAPYRALGQGAVGNLGFLSGIDTTSSVPALSSTVPNAPYGTKPPSLSTLGAPSAGGLVNVKAPNGTVYQVPQAQVTEAQQNGGMVLGA